MFSRLIHVVACISISFLFIAKYTPLYCYPTFPIYYQLIDPWVVSILAVSPEDTSIFLNYPVIIAI